MTEILSKEDYISLTSRLNQFSEAINLLELLRPMLGHHSLQDHDSATIDISQQARRLMLAVISKMCGEQSNIPYDPHSNMLQSLFYVLNHVEVRSISNMGCILLKVDSLDILLQQMDWQ